MCIIELVDYNETMLASKEPAKAKTTRRRRTPKKAAEVISPAVELPKEVAEEVKVPVKKPRRSAKKGPVAEESPELPLKEEPEEPKE